MRDEHSTSHSSQMLWCTAVFVAHTIAVLTLSTSGIQASDSSEFVLSAALGSRVHPPGYPLLSIWCGLFQWLSDNPMWNTAVAMGVFHSCAITLLFSALTRWTRSIGVSLWSVGLLAATPLWIRYSTIPEAFPALSLVFAGLVWLLSFEHLTTRHAIVLSGLLCLGIGSHHLFVFSFPIILWLMWQLRRFWWIYLIGIACGFASYGVLFLSSQTSWAWGEVSTVSDLIRYFLRTDYGTFQITHHEELGTWWGTPLVYIQTLMVESWGVFLMGFVGLKNMVHKEKLLLLAWLLASVFVLSLFGMPTTPTYLSHSNRFFLSSMVLWLPFVAKGTQWLLRIVPQNINAVIKVWSVVPVAIVLTNIPVAGRFDTRMQDWIEHSCAVFPENSLVFVAGDGAVFGSVLGQEVLGLCSQVQFVYPRLLTYEWYQRRLIARGIQGETMLHILQQHSGSAFSVLGLVGADADLPLSVPFGGYWMQFIPPGTPLPSPEIVESHLREQGQQMNLSELSHPFLLKQSAENWPLEQWGHSWLALGEAYRSFEEQTAADACFQYGQQWLTSAH